MFREWAELTLLLKQSRVAGHRLESYADLSNANQLPNPTWTEFLLSKPRQNSTLIPNISKFLVDVERRVERDNASQCGEATVDVNNTSQA